MSASIGRFTSTVHPVVPQGRCGVGARRVWRFLDNFPFGAAFGKGLTFKMGHTHMHKYMPKLLDHIQKGDIDPSVIITHRLQLQDAPEGYSTS